MACKTILPNDSYMHDCCKLSRRLPRRGMVRFCRPALACHILEYPKGAVETLLPWRVSHGDHWVCTQGGQNCQTSRISGLLSASSRSPHELCSHFHSYTWRLICETSMTSSYARCATLPILNYQIYDATSQQDQEWFDLMHTYNQYMRREQHLRR